MNLTFSNKKAIKICVVDRIKSIELASLDLARDLQELSFNTEDVSNETNADIVIKIDNSLTFLEEYKIEINSKVILSGKDDLGVMWAIYTFLMEDLNIPPFYKFDGIKLNKTDLITLKQRTVQKHPVTRFRGWFVNDEDLLENFQSLGTRDINYYFYKKVIHPELFSLVVETALRYRMNLIIPSTLIDIKNPYEKKLVEIASKRGLYISQHHIEPLGVSRFALEKYFDEKKIKGKVSYIHNKEAFMSCWEEYASLWSKFPRVIYQIGLRGKGDRPVWEDEIFENTDKAHGELISDAINSQVKIIKKFNKGKPLLLSYTMWMESAHLYDSGYLDIPNNTIIVFSDIGASGMFGDDFYNVPRFLGRYNYGVYYHAGYWNVGSHLVDGVVPQKMLYNYRLVYKTNANYYSIINVANVKEFTFSLFLNSLMIFNGADKKLDEYYCFYSRYYKEKSDNITTFLKTFYQSFTDGTDSFYKMFCELNNFTYRKYDVNFPIFSINDGYLSWYMKRPFDDKVRDFDPILGNSLEESITLIENSLLCLKEIKDEAFKSKWEFTSLEWLELVKAAYEVYISVSSTFYSNKSNHIHLNNAKAHLSNIISLRKEYVLGKWLNWYDGDKKIDISSLKNLLSTK